MAVHLIVTFFACCIVSSFYWHVVHPVLITSVRFRLFARRDELRRLAIDRKEDYESYSYREVEGFICKTVAVVPSISLLSFVWFMIRNQSCGHEHNADRFRREASRELVRMMHKTAGDGMWIMTSNSPILVIVAGFVALMMWVAGKFNRFILYREAENFIDDLPNDTPSITHQAA